MLGTECRHVLFFLETQSSAPPRGTATAMAVSVAVVVSVVVGVAVVVLAVAAVSRRSMVPPPLRPNS